MFKCPCYHDLRQSPINKATVTKANFLLLNDVEELRHVVDNHSIYVAKFIIDAMQRRKSVLILETIHLLPVHYINMHIFRVFESERKMHMQTHV